MLISEFLPNVRSGEIFHLQSPEIFQPMFQLFSNCFGKALKTDEPFKDVFDTLSWEQFDVSLNTVVSELDASKEHYKLFSNILFKNGVTDELVLIITLDKSIRLCLSNRGKKNYGYFIHRDSWFDLPPDGINFVFYLTAVPYNGNTVFFPEFFKTNMPYDKKTRRLIDESSLTRTTSYNCRSGDVLVFAGDHLHGGALLDVSRFSVEFRLSQLPNYGRKNEGIYYRSIRDFLS